MFDDPFKPPTPRGLEEFRRAMRDAASSGSEVWILTKAGERIVGEVEAMAESSEDQDLFGTAVQSDREWPERYGVVGDYVPNGFGRQFVFPFVWKG